jgi:aminopeptidase C
MTGFAHMDKRMKGIDIEKYYNFVNVSENDALDLLKAQARSSYWNQHLNMDTFGFVVETDASQEFFVELEKAKECLALMISVEEPCWMRLAAKDKDDEWNICDGDPLYLYERESESRD